MRPEIVIRLRSEDAFPGPDRCHLRSTRPIGDDLRARGLARTLDLGCRAHIEAALADDAGPSLRTGSRDQTLPATLGRVTEVASRRLYAPGPALIELARLTDGRNDQWALDSVHGAGHADVSPDAVRSIRSKLTGAGILIPSRFNEPRHVRSVGHLLGMFDLDCWVLGDREAEAPLASIEHEQFA